MKPRNEVLYVACGLVVILTAIYISILFNETIWKTVLEIALGILYFGIFGYGLSFPTYRRRMRENIWYFIIPVAILVGLSATMMWQMNSKRKEIIQRFIEVDTLKKKQEGFGKK